MFILAAQFALLALFAHITDAMGKRLDAAERRIVAQTNRLDDAERSIHKLKTNHQSGLEDVQRKLRDLWTPPRAGFFLPGACRDGAKTPHWWLHSGYMATKHGTKKKDC